MTQTVKASELPDYQRQYWPLFIDDNEPQIGLDGVLLRSQGDFNQ
ncbi:MAG: hypothetical protein U5N53_18460 [Mycobacterium sp.]|nr:hypothetical protein [Mycobacterium sp.]